MTIIATISLGLIATAVGGIIYSQILLRHIISDVHGEAKAASIVANKVVNMTYLSTSTMEIYEELSENDKLDKSTSDNYGYYEKVKESNDYKTLYNVLTEFKENSDIKDIYFAMYDEDTSSLVYIVDTGIDDKEYKETGEYKKVSKKELNTFLNDDKESALYYVSKDKNSSWICKSGVPIYGTNGKMVGFIFVESTLKEIVPTLVNFIFCYVIIFSVFTIIAGISISFMIGKNLINPINELATVAQNYANDKKNGITDTKHFSSLNINTKDEVENLSLVMADMERDLADYVKNLTKVTSEKERVGAELNMASEIQDSMLPNTYPAFPDRKEFDIYGSMDPAREVGGDFYDFFLIDKNHLCMVMADVSGKGVPAALFMMTSKIILANNAMMGKSPTQILKDTNNTICSNNRMDMFVTVWLGILEISTGVLVAANAGHEYPIIRHADGDYEIFKDVHGLVIGGMEDMEYTEYQLRLRPGSNIFLYTDGLPEATNHQKEMFGMDRIIQVLNSGDNVSPKNVLKNIHKSVDDFVGSAEQFDDLTMMCFEYKGIENNMDVKNKISELSIEATIENLEKVEEFIDTNLDKCNFSAKQVSQIKISVEEIYVNIAHYAYSPNTGIARISVNINQEEKFMEIIFIDQGKPYNLLEKKDPDVNLTVMERQVGGLGIYMTKKLMDDISYEYSYGKNILTLKKNWD